jgi:transcriptional regulator with XRE-family HTH domain
MTELFAGAMPERSLKELLLEGRLRSKLTIGDLARKLGVTVAFYEAIEDGSKVPASKWIKKLAGLLAVPLDQLEAGLEAARAEKGAERAR